ncbi:TetR/AcrR family transcriptional regulator [Streptomyces rectiverticillatus]|uniref:TetR/AcrR family transcriptional regulator n=1 Tax=Streptomyces rectiverticillatus TaxID=173860 RepID=UPI0015C3E07D|nr:TetR/AcrR family transcriptional regulator [Streptomyces rectiverticillatus]QLE70590.1 TetR/AcrR family transcriptional regulator [Streptomyces rectiverticillatus]
MDDTPPTTDGAPLGRRERNKLKVRSRLYESALKLFTEKGYEQTSVDEIAEAADVARGTFFNHFQRKEDLISAWGEQRRTRLRAGLSASVTGRQECLRVALERCMRILADINEAERDVTRSMLMAWVKAGRPMQEAPYAGEIFAEVVEAARERGELPEGVNAYRVGCLLRDVYLGTLYRWSQAQGQDAHLDLRTELHAVCTIILDGVLPAGRLEPATVSG